MFVADALGAWLIRLVADVGRKSLVNLILGTEQERALRSAATAAVELTAKELRPQDEEQAEQLQLVVDQVFFSDSLPDLQMTQHATVTEALESGIAERLAVLDDSSITGQGQSSADLLGVSGTVLAQKLTGHLMRQIMIRGSRGGPLEPLANQLNHEKTQLQGQEIRDALRWIGSVIVDRLDTTLTADHGRSQATIEVGPLVDQLLGGLELGDHEKAERRVNRLFIYLSRNQQQVVVDAIIQVATTTEDHAALLIACSLLEAADRLDPMLVKVEDVERLARSADFSLRSSAAVLMWQWAEALPGRVPVPLLSGLAQPSTEDWYVHAPARAGAKQLLLRRAASRAIFERMAASRDQTDREYAAADLLEVAKTEPRAVPADLARKLARDQHKSVAALAAELLRIIDHVGEDERRKYYGPFGL